MDYPVKTLSQLRPILLGFRKKAGLTQEAVAQRLGISQQSYAAFEANPETASVERLFRVLRLFDVEIKLGAPEAQASPVVAKAPARPAKTPVAAAKMSSATAPSAVRKPRRATPAAAEPPQKSAPNRKPRENW